MGGARGFTGGVGHSTRAGPLTTEARQLEIVHKKPQLSDWLGAGESDGLVEGDGEHTLSGTSLNTWICSPCPAKTNTIS